MNGRHFNLMFLITLQFSISIPPSFRSQIDYIFIAKETFISNRKRLYEHYAGMFPSFEIFCQVMNQCTENYECLVIDNTSKSSQLNDIVYWYKAQEHPPFKIGAPEFWQYHSNNYADNDEEEEDVLDVNKIHKKNTISVNVKKTY